MDIPFENGIILTITINPITCEHSVHTTNDQLTHQQYAIEIPSFFIHPLAPSIVDKPPNGSSTDHKHYPTWRLSNVDL